MALAGLVLAEGQVQKTVPPSTAAEQGAPPVQSAPAPGVPGPQADAGRGGRTDNMKKTTEMTQV